jgi:hypothetical protein
MGMLGKSVRFEGMEQTNPSQPSQWKGRVSMLSVSLGLTVAYGRQPGALTVTVGEDEETVHLKTRSLFDAQCEEIAPAVQSIAAVSLLAELSDVDFVDSTIYPDRTSTCGEV